MTTPLATEILHHTQERWIANNTPDFGTLVIVVDLGTPKSEVEAMAKKYFGFDVELTRLNHETEDR